MSTRNKKPHPHLVQLFSEAVTYQMRGNPKGALIVYRKIHTRFPDFADAWINASTVLELLGRFEEAIEAGQKGVELAPASPIAYCSLANAQKALGKFRDAEPNYLKAIELDSKHFAAMTGLGGIYTHWGQFEMALELQNMAVELQPGQPILWGNRGQAKMAALDMDGAEKDLRQAAAMDPTNVQVRWNLVLVLLLQHRYEEAWPHFKARLQLKEWLANRQAFDKPRWNGEQLNGRTLLIYMEQGLGEAIHFSRFIPRLSRYGGRIALSIFPSLKRLMEGLAGLDELIVEGGALPHYDFVVPIMDLPVVLNIGASEMAPEPPPILPEGNPPSELDRPGFKVGLVWAGNPHHTNDALRSMNPRLLDELGDMLDIAWYGLQKKQPQTVNYCGNTTDGSIGYSPQGNAETEPPQLPGFVDLSPHFGDFMDTAQIIRHLDLIVTIDTSVAHLAGFLGLPTIVLLPYFPDWRWGLRDRHTGWYPSITLLRQPAHGDWQGVVGLLRGEIASRVANTKKT